MNIINEIKQQYKLGDVPQKLIFINILVFLLSIVFFFKFRFGIFDYPTWLALSSDYKEAIWFPWTLLTYSFLHSSPFHLLFNLIFLYFISSLFYTYFNTRQFLTVYFFGSVFAGFVYLLYGYLFNGVSEDEAFSALMGREKTSESEGLKQLLESQIKNSK